MAYDHIFAALADPNRRVLLDHLRQGPMPVTALAATLPISRPAVSQHLRVLSDAGLLECEQCGTRRFYRLSGSGLEQLKAYSDQLWSDALAAFAAHAQSIAEKETAMTTDPIVKTLIVPLPPKRAFEVFTKDLSNWWPVETHSLSAAAKDTPRDLTVEADVGGQILETLPDGTQAPWGRITAYDPGERLAMTWHVGRSEGEATHVDIRFDPVPEGTRVTLIHDGWSVHGAAATSMRANYHAGWDHILTACYGQACAAMLVS
ncbi:MAG: metalloregulator ArsR/SmtB family transcription factor [Pseudomonadota bacterium]